MSAATEGDVGKSPQARMMSWDSTASLHLPDGRQDVQGLALEDDQVGTSSLQTCASHTVVNATAEFPSGMPNKNGQSSPNNSTGTNAVPANERGIAISGTNFDDSCEPVQWASVRTHPWQSEIRKAHLCLRSSRLSNKNCIRLGPTLQMRCRPLKDRLWGEGVQPA